MIVYAKSVKAIGVEFSMPMISIVHSADKLDFQSSKET